MKREGSAPGFAARLLRLTVPDEWRLSVYGDLEEEWRKRLAAGLPRWRARLWFLQQVLGIAGRFFSERLADAASGNRLRRSKDDTPNWDQDPSVQKGDGLMQALWQDIRYGLRTLRKNPGFTAVAVLTLALGIGANAAIFNIVHGVLFRPLPYPGVDRLVKVWGTDKSNGTVRDTVSYPNFREWQERNRVFSHLAVFHNKWVNYTTADGTERLRGALVTAEFFPALKIKPLHGRFFLPEEDLEDAEAVAILTYGFWQRRLGADPEIVGDTLTLNGKSTRVVGILPQTFDFPLVMRGAEIWVPAAPDAFAFQQRQFYAASSLARLKPGATLEQAQAGMDSIAAQLSKEFPQANHNRGVNLVPLYDEVVGESRTSLLLLLGVTGFVLLIACANLASLLLSRGTARQAEFSIRRALGAGRGRLIRQMLTESALLGLGGGALGMLAAPALTAGLVSRLNSWGVPRLDEVQMDAWVIGFTAALSLLSAILFGLLPAWQAGELPLAASLKEGSRTGTSGHRTRVRQLLIIGEVALSLVLLTGAGLMVRSFVNLSQVSPGFETNNLLKVRILATGPKYDDPEIQANFFRELTDQITALPGVIAAGASTTVPLAGGSWRTDFHILSRMDPETEDGIEFRYYSAMPDYFQALGIPLLRGRLFTEQDRKNPVGVAVINRTMAEQYWPNGNPLGERLKVGISFGQEGEPTTFEIIGVVGDVRHTGLDTHVLPQIYIPYRQQTNGAMSLMVRTEGDPLDSLDAVRARIAAVDKNAPIYQVTTMEALLERATASRRVAATLLGGFSLLALVLTCVGLFGVLSYTVSQRGHEFGVRLALGAQPGDILRLVFRQSFVLIGLGSVAGLAGAVGLTRLLDKFLFGVSATDPLTFGLTVLLLTVVALLACYIPARRAMRVDPMVALRYE